MSIALPPYITDKSLTDFIQAALKEDVGAGDYSSLASVPVGAQQNMKLLVKENCVIAGISLAQQIFQQVNPAIQIEPLLNDGQIAKKGDVAFYVHGPAQSLLTAERIVLNCMQRMSGIATLTHQMQQRIAHTQAILLDTRKTTPNFRLCEKWAVKIGGGQNHRFGLYDMIMLKDNHCDFAGGITNAVQQTTNYLKNNHLSLKIEVETRNLQEVAEAISLDAVDIIMLDNMSIQMMREAVQMIRGNKKSEASGDVALETIQAIAETGVDFISCGKLTHSAPNIDLSLKYMN